MPPVNKWEMKRHLCYPHMQIYVLKINVKHKHPTLTEQHHHVPLCSEHTLCSHTLYNSYLCSKFINMLLCQEVTFIRSVGEERTCFPRVRKREGAGGFLEVSNSKSSKYVIDNLANLFGDSVKICKVLRDMLRRWLMNLELQNKGKEEGRSVCLVSHDA